MSMKELTSLADLNVLKATEKGILILFGGQNCGVCHTIKPRLTALMEQQYPKMTLVYVDCHLVPDVCAQNGVLSLPTLQVFFEGKCFLRRLEHSVYRIS
ncbi:MAG: thioredoxin family protein [Thiomicrorhabdus sp.]|nr:thioredoxin family protein [Thiomicrorhabdus sp.]